MLRVFASTLQLNCYNYTPVLYYYYYYKYFGRNILIVIFFSALLSKDFMQVGPPTMTSTIVQHNIILCCVYLRHGIVYIQHTIVERVTKQP